MKKKLILLDLVLLALISIVGARIRQKWFEAKKRESVILRLPVKPLPPTPYAPLPKIEPLSAAAYAEVAQKMLFAPDRNPTVVIEVAPPKPMPALPVVHGVMDLGDGPTAIMSPKSGAAHRGFRPGEKIGEFTLVSVNGYEIVLEWDGKKIQKKVEELIDRSAEAAAAAAPEAPAPAAPQPAATKLAPAARSGPGAEMGQGVRACQPGDSAAPGTVADGLRKVVSDTPFGKVCRWEPVK